ncbi:MAG: UDP-3-O-(3-hydroxymyristoyl)glucosamine N-acyltransferase [Armatimonadetes bacterium]|nr:UDP-3-O-(3-hydroxymyristoyl)glucosamine N-acyltransferase [Akkermansiaceae bacterium]
MAISLSLSELASRIDGKIICGKAGSLFYGMASLDTAGPSDISFLGNEKYLPQFHATRAGSVIVPEGFEFKTDGPALIAVSNPSLGFAEVVRHFAVEPKPFTPGIHPGAHVAPTAKADPGKVCIHAGAVIMDDASIGEGTEISPNAVIQTGASIGKNCQIGANVTIREGCIIGDRVLIQPGAVIGSDGYGYEFSEGRHIKIDQVGIVEIGNDVEIGANTTIDRARFGKTIIGEGTKIDNLVQIAHNVVLGKHCLIVSQSGLAGSCRIEDHVIVAAQSGIAGHVVIGEKAILSARSGATTSLPGGITYSGKPALPMKEEVKLQAHVRRLPKMLARIKALEAALLKSSSTDL